MRVTIESEFHWTGGVEMRRISLLFAALLITAGVWAQGNITLIANGKRISSDPPATLQAGRVYVPLRAAAEAVGGKVEYDAATKRVTICRGPMCTVVMQNEGITIGGRLLIGVEDASREVRGVVTAPPIEIGGIQGISAQRLQPQSHNIDRRVLVAVHHQPTMGTDMDSIREGLFDDHTTSGTSL